MIISTNILEKIKIKEENKNIDIQSTFPSSWNHLKRQYVAVIVQDTPYFISETYNPTRSGCNSDIRVECDFEKDDIFMVYDGSHKHMTQTYYVVVNETTCHKIIEIENDEICDDISEKEIKMIYDYIEKRKRQYKLSKKRQSVMKAAHIISKEIQEETGSRAIFSECLKLAWKYGYKYDGWSSMLKFIEKEKEKELKRNVNNPSLF